MLRIALGVCALAAVIALLPTERSISRALTSRSPQAPEAEPRRVPRDPEFVAPNLTVSDADQRWQATLEMIECGPAAIPALVEAERLSTFDRREWTGSHWCIRAHVQYAVLQIGKPAIAPLTEALEGDHRIRAIRLLGVLGTRYDEVLEPLVACLDPEGHEDTYSAAFALSRMEERAAPALPDLARIFECEGISWAVADSMVRIGPAAVPYIERELQRSYNGRLMGNLQHLDAHCGPLVPTLIEILQRGKSHQKRDAAWAITEIGPPAAAAREVLLEYALHPKTLGWATSISGNYCAVDALLAIGVPDDEAEKLIDSILERGEVPSLRMCERVARMDPDRAGLLRPRMAPLLRGFGLRERLEALDPGWRPATAPEPPPDTRTLNELLDIPPVAGPHWRGLERGIPRRYRTLADRAPLPPRAVEVLRKQLTAGDAADRVGAAFALHASGVDPRVYVQALIEGLRPENFRGLGMSRRRYRDTGLRVTAIETLADLGERAALPALYYVLNDRSESVRAAARAALARLE